MLPYNRPSLSDSPYTRTSLLDFLYSRLSLHQSLTLYTRPSRPFLRFRRPSHSCTEVWSHCSRDEFTRPPTMLVLHATNTRVGLSTRLLHPFIQYLPLPSSPLVRGHWTARSSQRTEHPPCEISSPLKNKKNLQTDSAGIAQWMMSVVVVTYPTGAS